MKTPFYVAVIPTLIISVQTMAGPGSFDNNVQIFDTSETFTFLSLNNGNTAPDSDWFIANNGVGSNEFTIGTSTGGAISGKFWLSHDAPTGSIVVGTGGNIGLGGTVGSLPARLNLAADSDGNSNISFAGTPFWIGAKPNAYGVLDFSSFDGSLQSILNPFTTSAGAPNDSLFISPSGRVGLGTRATGGPLGSNLTVSNSGSGLVPSSIFMDDGVDQWSFGATQSIGAFIANGTTGYLNIAKTGNVGLSQGNAAPEAKLHVGGTDDAKILVKNLGNGLGTKVMYNLVNDGGIRFDMTDNSTGSNWVFQNQSGTFDVTLAGTGTREFRFYPNGNLEISGTYQQSSSRSIKTGVEPIDSQSVLDKVVALPITSWSYNREVGVRHIGPMSEDFYASFGLGGNNRTITTVDAGGVALAAIQGLKQEKDDEMQRLRLENDALRLAIQRLRVEQDERLLQLEMALTKVLRNQSEGFHVSTID